MNIFNTFKHGNDLVEIFIEGRNPYAKQHLSHADVDALRLRLPSGEPLMAYAIGRVVGAGRGVWAVTDKTLLAFMPGHHPSFQSWALEQLTSFEALKGKYGYTLRAVCHGETISMYGADHSLTLMCQRAVAARNLHSTFTGDETLDATQALQAIELITDAALRSQPAVMAGLHQEGLSTRMQQVNQQGLILNEELDALMTRVTTRETEAV